MNNVPELLLHLSVTFKILILWQKQKQLNMLVMLKQANT